MSRCHGMWILEPVAGCQGFRGVGPRGSSVVLHDTVVGRLRVVGARDDGRLRVSTYNFWSCRCVMDFFEACAGETTWRLTTVGRK